MNRIQVAVAVATLGMEMCWLFGAVALVSLTLGMPGPALSFLGVLALVGLAYGAAWVLERLDFSLAALQATGAAVGVITITTLAQLHVLGPAGLAPWNPVWFVPWLGGELVGQPLGRAILATVAGLLLWWRSVRVAQRDPGLEPVLRGFRIGFVVISVEALLEAFFEPATSAAWVGLPFFGLGLVALSLAHFEEVGLDAWSGSVRRWAWLPPVVIGAMVLVAVNVGLGLYAWAWDAVLTVLSAIDQGATLAFLAIVVLVGLLAEVFVYVLRWLLTLVGASGAMPQFRQFESFVEDLRRNPPTEDSWFRIVAYLLMGAVVFLIASGVLLWLAKALGRRRNRDWERDEEERESLWTEGALGEELQDLAAHLLGRFRRGTGGPALAGLGTDPRSLLLAFYYRLLALAALRGVQREAWQTAVEFQRHLTGAFPGGASHVARLTQGFVAARYGSAAPSDEAVERARQDWEVLRRPRVE